MTLTTFVRGAATCGLLILVYRETGWATTLAMGLCALHAELVAYAMRRKANRP